MTCKNIIVSNPSGLHVNPANVLVSTAEKCSSRVEILYQHHTINAKSLLNIVSVAIRNGTEIELRCSGPNEQEDMDRIVNAMQHLE